MIDLCIGKRQKANGPIGQNKNRKKASARRRHLSKWSMPKGEKKNRGKSGSCVVRRAGFIGPVWREKWGKLRGNFDWLLRLKRFDLWSPICDLRSTVGGIDQSSCTATSTDGARLAIKVWPFFKKVEEISNY